MVNVRKNVLVVALALVCALAACCFAGCSGSSSAGSSSSSSASSAPQYTKISTSANAAKTVLLENQLGVDITNISIKATTVADFPTGAMSAGQTWAKGEKAELLYDGGSAAYDVLITAGTTTYTLHAVELEKVTEGALCIKDGVAYLTYQVDGATMSTLDHELEVIAAEKAAAEAAEAAAEAEKEAEEAAAQQSQSYSYGSTSGSGSGSGSTSQKSDGCVEGGVALR